MKKFITAVSAILFAMSAGAISVSAEETAEVYVTIADANGAIAMAQEKVTVTDIDADSVLTINDALYAAHEAAYEGGAAAGYGTASSEYGLSLTKLWGEENGGSYGYYVNNASAMSLSDTVKDGDYISAFVYTDLSAWSDTYCFFDVNTITAEEDTAFTLTLSAAGYDANWNAITVPVEGAVITLNGQATEFVTDADGKVEITAADAGECIISAKSESQILVPPVCIAEISAAETTAPTETTTTAAATTTVTTTTTVAATTTAATTTKGSVSPSTGDAGVTVALAACGAACLFMVAAAKSRKSDEK